MGTHRVEARGWAYVEEVALRKPAGKTGYVMNIQLEAGSPPLYVKLELGSGTIFGRSFHYSKHR